MNMGKAWTLLHLKLGRKLGGTPCLTLHKPFTAAPWQHGTSSTVSVQMFCLIIECCSRPVKIQEKHTDVT